MEKRLGVPSAAKGDKRDGSGSLSGLSLPPACWPLLIYPELS